ncbi:MAG: GldG family protein [Verrucomicrobiae bacterium]|nr:GldG family protein [Verrucomicrobiae bacterium]
MSENTSSDTQDKSAAESTAPTPSSPPTGQKSSAGTSGSEGKSLMFGIVGVIIAFAIVIGLNIIGPSIPGRVDFTENKRHTLSDGTRTILDRLDTEVQVKFYVSQGGEEKIPSVFLNRVRDIENLLREYKREGGGHIKVQKIDPQPDTEEEYNAQLAGIARTQFSDRSEAYYGIAVSCLDQTQALPAIAGISDEQFEYHLTRAISQVFNPKKKKVGLMSALPMTGNPMARQQASIFYQQLEQDYDVEMIEVTASKIADDVDVLVVVHPAGITEAGQYAIDQFILSGKNAVLMVDPFSIEAASQQPEQPQFPGQPPMGGVDPSSNLESLLNSWGLAYNATEAIADIRYRAPEFGDNPVALKLNKEAINTDDVVSEDLTSLLFVLTGGFTEKKLADGLEMKVLAETSESNQYVEPRSAMQDPDKVRADFKASGTKKMLALRLSGKFKTAFPDGPPKEEGEEDGDEKKDDQPAEGLKEAANPSAVYLFADTDFLSPQFALDRRFRSALANHNLPLALNVVEQASGDSALISIRSRASSERPFTKINEIEDAAQAEIVDRMNQLNSRISEIGQQTMTLKQGADGNLTLVMTDEDRSRYEKLKKEEQDARREIRDLRIQAKQEVTSELNAIKWRNILGMPIVIAVIGIVVSLLRKLKTGAK